MSSASCSESPKYARVVLLASVIDPDAAAAGSALDFCRSQPEPFTVSQLPVLFSPRPPGSTVMA
ncbi:hypothetical protein [Microbacterium hydrothermale]|uniref:hypothetical protein n=1 Tax=Microbacterium hydrothermale TaxID=857427 RepID=UPI00222607C8|nr:hypothetical protein [Microbacterium hydrothermale]